MELSRIQVMFLQKQLSHISYVLRHFVPSIHAPLNSFTTNTRDRRTGLSRFQSHHDLKFSLNLGSGPTVIAPA